MLAWPVSWLLKLLMFVSIISSLVSESRAHAQEAPETDGERLFKEGLALLETAQQTKDRALFDQACDRFERSFAAEKLISPLLNLARCEEGRGRLRAAWKTWQAAADLAREQGESTAQILAQGGAASVAEKLPKLLVRLGERGGSATIEIDGERANPGEAFPVDPGAHKVRATIGGLVEEKEVLAERGVVEVELLGKEKVVEPGPAPAPTPSPPDEGVNLAIPGWTLVGVGGAAWIGVAVTSALWFDDCEGFTCDEAPSGGLSISNVVLWFAAPIITGIGATLLIVEATGEDSAAPPVAVGVRAWSTGDGGRVGVFGSF